MNKISIIAFLLLILSSLSFAQFYNPYKNLLNGVSPLEEYTLSSWSGFAQTGQWAQKMTFDVYTTGLSNFLNSKPVYGPYPWSQTIHFYGITDVTSVRCWANFVFTSSNSSNSVSSRWVLAEPKTWTQTPISNLMHNENDYTFTVTYEDSNSSSVVGTLCNSGDIMVSWYGGKSDTYNKTGKLMEETELMANRGSYSKGTFYMCISPSQSDKHNITYNHGGSVVSTYGVYTTTNIVCARLAFNDSREIKVNVSGAWLTTFVKSYTNPPYSGANRTYSVKVTASTLDDLAQQDWISSITRGMINGLKDIALWMNDQVRGAACNLPEPFPTILKTLSSIIDFIIMFIGVFLIYQVVKYFLTFRKSLQRSLSKSAIVFMQMIIFAIILVSFFYAITHTQTYCGLKAGVTIFALKQVGIQFIIPQSITDVPAALWDLMYISVLQGTVSECNKDGMGYGDCSVYFGQPNTTFSLTCTEGEAGCQSLIIRITEIVLLLSVIIVFIATLWEITRYIFRKTKQFEEEVRRPDESEYDDSDEEP